ncbi:MAG: ImpA family type VI secretion system protein, partial [Iodobacter sp.]
MLSHLFKSVFGDKTPAEEGEHRLQAWTDWLNPVSVSAPTGADPAYEDDFLAIKEELGKLSGQNDALILQASEKLLKESSKDLRLAAYYAYARLRRDGASGLADGLELIAALVSHFGEALYPARPEGKRIALEWLNSARFLELLEQTGTLPREELERSISALAMLELHTRHWADTARPDLTPLLQRFKTPLLNRPAPVLPGPAAEEVSAGRNKISSARELLEQGRQMS